MSDIINLLPDDQLIIIIHESNNCKYKFVCKRWYKIYSNFKNYSNYDNNIQILNSDEKFILDKLVITDINKAKCNLYNKSFFDKLVKYDDDEFIFQTPFFKISKNYVFDRDWINDLGGTFEFILNNDCHGCHNLKHFFDMIDKKIENEKESILLRINEVINERKLVYDNIVKKDNFNNYYWRAHVDISNINIFQINDLIRTLVNYGNTVDYIEDIIKYIPIGSSIKCAIRTKNFRTFLKKYMTGKTTKYGFELHITEIEFISPKDNS